MVYRNHRNQIIGEYSHGVFRKQLRAEHYLRSPEAICINAAVIRNLHEKQMALNKPIIILVIDRQKVKRYSLTLPEFERYCFMIHRKHGTQLGVALERWRNDGVVQYELLA